MCCFSLCLCQTELLNFVLHWAFVFSICPYCLIHLGSQRDENHLESSNLDLVASINLIYYLQCERLFEHLIAPAKAHNPKQPEQLLTILVVNNQPSLLLHCHYLSPSVCCIETCLGKSPSITVNSQKQCVIRLSSSSFPPHATSVKSGGHILYSAAQNLWQYFLMLHYSGSSLYRLHDWDKFLCWNPFLTQLGLTKPKSPILKTPCSTKRLHTCRDVK